MKANAWQTSGRAKKIELRVLMKTNRTLIEQTFTPFAHDILQSWPQSPLTAPSTRLLAELTDLTHLASDLLHLLHLLHFVIGSH